MEKKYKVRVSDKFEFEFTEDQISELDTQPTSSTEYHLLKNQRSFKAEVVEKDFLNKKYQVKINANTYQVNISNQLDILIDEMGLSIRNAHLVNDIKAPMPGLILEVRMAPGDEVKEGDYLLVLEAMKMENTIAAPRDGVVKSVSVQKGETVEKNQLLIEME